MSDLKNDSNDFISFSIVRPSDLSIFLINEREKIDKEDPLYQDLFDLTDLDLLLNIATLPNRFIIGIYYTFYLAGYAAIMNCKPTLHLDNLFISKEWRNKKIGKFFLERYPIQSVFTNPKNQRAIDLYLSSGFKIKTKDLESKNSIHLTRVRKWRDIKRIR